MSDENQERNGVAIGLLKFCGLIGGIVLLACGLSALLNAMN